MKLRSKQMMYEVKVYNLASAKRAGSNTLNFKSSIPNAKSGVVESGRYTSVFVYSDPRKEKFSFYSIKTDRHTG
jgi:hypothetical protein